MASAIGAVAGGLISARATGKAADAQVEAAEAAAQVQREQYQQIRTDLAPYREGGGNAFVELQALLGLGGAQQQQEAFGRFTTSPGYDFRFKEGLRAVDQGAASRGMALSGAAQKGLLDFAGGLAAREYGTYYDQLAGVAGSGQNAAAGTGTAGMQAADNVGNALFAAGDARARGFQGVNAIAGGVQQAVNQIPEGWNPFGSGTSGLPASNANYVGPNALPLTNTQNWL